MATEAQLVSKLQKATKDLTALATTMDSEISARTTKVEDLDYKIADKTAALQNISKEYEVKAKEAKIDFGVTIKESKEKALREALGSNYVIVPQSMLDEHEKYVAETSATIEKAVGAALNKAKASFNTQLKEAELENQKTNIDNESKLKSANFEITILKNQVADLKTQLDENRKAQVKMAEAQAITVNTGK